MILTLDVGNSQIFGGVFDSAGKIIFRFRKVSSVGSSSDELGLFLTGVLREEGLGPHQIERIAICSVVPNLMHSLRNCCLKYFKRNPFVLQMGVKTGLKILYRNPQEVGSDRIANAIAATQRFPEQNIVVIDFGTATTFCVLTARKEYLGGVIYPGLKVSMETLEMKTAKLPTVEIIKPERIVGRSTVECIQSGLYYGTLGLVRDLIIRIRREYFQGESTIVVGTGGLSRLYESEDVFDALEPDLVHYGLYQALKLNL